MSCQLMKCSPALLLIILLSGCVGTNGVEQTSGARSLAPPLSAEESDPIALGWQQGFPPPPERRIEQPSSNYFSFPKLRWSVCHIRELLPTTRVSRGLGAPSAFAYALDPAIDALEFSPLDGRPPLTWRASLFANYTDGIIVLHEGRIVYEEYFGALTESGVHAAMSVTKSMSGLLAEVLVAEGQLDDSRRVDEIVPELAGSAFGDATVRQVMDMTTALRFSEDYSDSNAEIWQYNTAASPLPRPESETGPRGYYEYLATVQKNGVHGEAFGYKTVNTDVLAWVLARTTGKSLTELLSDRIWSRIGAEQDAYFTVDGLGTPFAGGGMSAGLRDMARLGQLVLDRGRFGGEQVLPETAIAQLSAGGDPTAFAKAGYPWLDGGSYQSMWWFFHDDHQAFAARGVHGQTIYVDPTARMVIVRFASYPSAKNAEIDPTSLPAYRALGRYLLGKSSAR